MLMLENLPPCGIGMHRYMYVQGQTSLTREAVSIPTAKMTHIAGLITTYDQNRCLSGC